MKIAKVHLQATFGNLRYIVRSACCPQCAQVVKVEPYALPAAHKALLDLSRSLNRQSAPAGHQQHRMHTGGTDTPKAV